MTFMKVRTDQLLERQRSSRKEFAWLSFSHLPTFPITMLTILRTGVSIHPSHTQVEEDANARRSEIASGDKR